MAAAEESTIRRYANDRPQTGDATSHPSCGDRLEKDEDEDSDGQDDAYLDVHVDANAAATDGTSYAGAQSSRPGSGEETLEQRFLKGSRTDGFMKGSSGLLAEMWHPLPKGFSFVMKTFKDLKQSVVEVIRIKVVQIDLARVLAVEDAIAVVTVEGPSDRCCRRWKPQVFVTSQEQNLCSISESILRSQDMNLDCRVSRLMRRRRVLRVVVRLYGQLHKDKTSRGFTKESSFTKLYHKAKPLLTLHGVLPAFRSSANLMKVELKVVSCSRSGQATSSLAEITGWAKLEVLEGSHVFHVKRCQPMYYKYMNHNEWQPPTARLWREIWKSQWTQQCLAYPSVLLATMTAEMKHDIILMYQTLFSQSMKGAPLRPSLSDECLDLYDKRILFLKRLFLCLAVCKLTFCIEQNDKTTRSWPFPLASAFCHGGRVLIRLDGVSWQEFINFLLLGKPDAHDWAENAPPSPLTQRWAATHAVGLNHDTAQLYERKLKKRNTVKNLRDGKTGHHLGLNLPLGGLGNQAPRKAGGKGQLCVGPAGVPYRKIKTEGEVPQYVEEIQHGHLYMRWDDFGVTTVPVLATEGTDELESGGGNNGTSTNSEEADPQQWLQLPALHSSEDLETLLRDHGYGDVADDEDCLQRLYQSCVQDNELSIKMNEEGQLRCCGILVHLIMVMEDDGEEKILVHRAATAKIQHHNLEGDYFESRGVSDVLVEDIRMPTLVRQRHESWTEAVSRMCDCDLKLSARATSHVVETCRQAQDDMCIYKMLRPATLCHHHGAYGGGLQVEYKAYRFKFSLEKCVRHMFGPILKDAFTTTEEDVSVHKFGGHEYLRGSSSISRDWTWVTKSEAAQLGAEGLDPPEDRLQIHRETDHVCSILMGIESSAPGKQDFFCGTHNIRAQSKDVSPFGGRKWRDYRKGGQEVPADIGGMHVCVDQESFGNLQALCNRVTLTLPSRRRGCSTTKLNQEKDLFRSILQSSDQEVAAILQSRVEFSRPQLSAHQGGTTIFDSYIRCRSKLSKSSHSIPGRAFSRCRLSSQDCRPSAGTTTESGAADGGPGAAGSAKEQDSAQSGWVAEAQWPDSRSADGRTNENHTGKLLKLSI